MPLFAGQIGILDSIPTQVGSRTIVYFRRAEPSKRVYLP